MIVNSSIPIIWTKSELKGISGMQFLLKFEIVSDKLLPLSSRPYARKFVRDKLFSGVTQAARLFHKGTQFFYIFINNNPPSSAMNKEYLTHTVRVNTKIIDSDDNWNLLLYKEAYHIKRSAPSLNNGLKASRELCLFS